MYVLNLNYGVIFMNNCILLFLLIIVIIDIIHITKHYSDGTMLVLEFQKHTQTRSKSGEIFAGK